MKYHIFRVSDYKGGELSSSVNLDKEKFIAEIAERMYDEEIEDCRSFEEVKKLVERRTTQKYDGNDWLGTHEGFMGEIYVTEKESLRELDWNKLVDDLSQKLFKWLTENV